MTTFKDRLKVARLDKGWSQARLGEAAGVAQTRISEYENGTKPQDRTIHRLEAALGVTLTGESDEDQQNAARLVLTPYVVGCLQGALDTICGHR